MALKLGERFVFNGENEKCEAFVIYNRFEEDFVYTVVNASNYEVVEAYRRIEAVPVFNLVEHIAELILENKKNVLRYSLEGGVFKLAIISGVIVGSCGGVSPSILYNANITSPIEEKNVKMLCEALGIIRLSEV